MLHLVFSHPESARGGSKGILFNRHSDECQNLSNKYNIEHEKL